MLNSFWLLKVMFLSIFMYIHFCVYHNFLGINSLMTTYWVKEHECVQAFFSITLLPLRKVETTYHLSNNVGESVSLHFLFLYW